jgi:hypothetical protein
MDSVCSSNSDSSINNNVRMAPDANIPSEITDLECTTRLRDSLREVKENLFKSIETDALLGILEDLLPIGKEGWRMLPLSITVSFDLKPAQWITYAASIVLWLIAVNQLVIARMTSPYYFFVDCNSFYVRKFNARLILAENLQNDQSAKM